jgi:hypothetical protein
VTRKARSPPTGRIGHPIVETGGADRAR